MRELKGHPIVHVIAEYSPQIEEEVIAHASVLRSWGYDLLVIAPINRNLRQRFSGLGIGLVDASLPSDTSTRVVWSYLSKLASTIRAVEPMLIHAHGIPAAVASLLSRRGSEPAPPIVFSPHISLPGSQPWLLRMALRWALRSSDAIVLHTMAERRQLAAFSASSAARAEIVPYGITHCPIDESLDMGRRRQLLGMTPSAAIIGCVMYGLPNRTIEFFLDCARELSSAYPSLEFALIGSERNRSYYCDLAHQRGVLGAVVVVDPHDRLLRTLSALNVLVVLQQAWPSGMLALQALSQDVSVVAPSGGEIEEMLLDMPGVTVAAADDVSTINCAIINELHAATSRMPFETTHTNVAAVSPFLVSRESFDLDQLWTTPALAPTTDAEQSASLLSGVRAFAATRAARSLIAVFHRLLHQS